MPTLQLCKHVMATLRLRHASTRRLALERLGGDSKRQARVRYAQMRPGIWAFRRMLPTPYERQVPPGADELTQLYLGDVRPQRCIVTRLEKQRGIRRSNDLALRHSRVRSTSHTGANLATYLTIECRQVLERRDGGMRYPHVVQCRGHHARDVREANPSFRKSSAADPLAAFRATDAPPPIAGTSPVSASAR